jgi:hypothetical protein
VGLACLCCAVVAVCLTRAAACSPTPPTTIASCHASVATFLEANGRGYWEADDEKLERLRQLYTDCEDKIEGEARVVGLGRGTGLRARLRGFSGEESTTISSSRLTPRPLLPAGLLCVCAATAAAQVWSKLVSACALVGVLGGEQQQQAAAAAAGAPTHTLASGPWLSAWRVALCSCSSSCGGPPHADAGRRRLVVPPAVLAGVRLVVSLQPLCLLCC